MQPVRGHVSVEPVLLEPSPPEVPELPEPVEPALLCPVAWQYVDVQPVRGQVIVPSAFVAVTAEPALTLATPARTAVVWTVP